MDTCRAEPATCPQLPHITGLAVILHQKECHRVQVCKMQVSPQEPGRDSSVNDRKWYFLDCLMNMTEARGLKGREKGVRFSLGCQNKRL